MTRMQVAPAQLFYDFCPDDYRKHPVRAAGSSSAIRAGNATRPQRGWPEWRSRSRGGDRRRRERDEH
jgi:hypothetical protein